MTLKKLRIYAELLVIGICIVLFLLLNRSCDKISERNEFIDGLNDTLRTTRNELGQQTATISVLQFENDKHFTKVQTNDTTIKWLQKVVEQYKGKISSATVGSTITVIQGATETVVVHDTEIVYRNDTAFIYPTYKASFNNRWEEGSVTANKDSVWHDIKVKNEFELTLGKASNGWFKKKTFDASIKNLNPNTTIEELRTFSITQKPKRITLGLHFGYGIGVKDFKHQPFIGLGVGYTIFSIK